MDRVKIFDTTLRDGEQSPGVALNVEDKLEIARQLERLNVDIIEAGFAASSPGDFESVQRIAREIKGTTVASLARAVPNDVEQAIKALTGASAQPRVHVFISSSDIQVLHQLEKDRETVLEMARAMVARAKQFTSDVEFSPMDATRSAPEYLYRLLSEVIKAGATTINIPDTVGYTMPHEFSDMIKGIRENVMGVDNVTISVHCHNDLGLATANSHAAVLAGARQVEVCVNGIGERAGNAALEEVVMGIKVRPDLVGNVTTGVNTKELSRTSRLVSNLTGMSVQPNHPVVGLNAFRHQSGIHQAAVLKMRQTFEIMDPVEVGVESGSQIVLNKNSGRHGLKARLKDLGYEIGDEELSRIFIAFKDLADKKGEIDDRDLEALVAEKERTSHETYHLDYVQVTAGDHAIPTATVRIIRPDGDVLSDSDTGTGPVDAIYRAINRVVGVPNELIEFTVKSVTEGIDAQGEVTIRIEKDGKTYSGRGADTDILVASAKAYINALNRLVAAEAAGIAEKVYP